MSYDIESSSQERKERLIEFMHRDKQVFMESIQADLVEDFRSIKHFFDGIISDFNKPISKEIKVLFIGDCIHTDVMGSLSVLLMKNGISLSPHMITTKNIFQMRKEVVNFQKEKFDAIFYSPLSYENNLEFSSMIHHRNALISGSKLATSLATVFSQIENVLDKMLASFDCPIFVHNTACLIREESGIKLMIKSIMTKRLRTIAMSYIDEKLKAHIVDRNAVKFKQIHLVDELSLLSNDSLYELGKYMYKSPLQHPIKFGILLADKYSSILCTLTKLVGRKLIVCDLDNTLWDGVIGEGKVKHYIQKQKLLLKLKSKGVLLAINSKNDPANVYWDGGVLTSDDFVYASIDWKPKINAFPKMQRVLNLKEKAFIFIDDRLDELEFVRSTYPLIECLDATSESTWNLFELWESILDEPGLMDRTQMYKERELRDGFIKETDTTDFDEAEMFKNLKLMLTIEKVTNSGLKRTVELINRTNQFNMRGSRTTYNEAKSWLNNKSYTVLQASMKDKFGDMGVISVIVFDHNNAYADISIFVLSCRVFGYQVETAILNEVKKCVKSQGLNLIRGEYISTPSNLPCSNVYSDAKFIDKENYWEYTIDKGEDIDSPTWLNIVAN
jgi:FkbH-like protein